MLPIDFVYKSQREENQILRVKHQVAVVFFHVRC